jgi:hypothetical protein
MSAWPNSKSSVHLSRAIFLGYYDIAPIHPIDTDIALRIQDAHFGSAVRRIWIGYLRNRELLLYILASLHPLTYGVTL